MSDDSDDPNDSDETWLETAEALMRSRFAAFRAADAAWLLASWHPSTRPGTVDLSDNPTWRGLQIIDTVAGVPATTRAWSNSAPPTCCPAAGWGCNTSGPDSCARAGVGTTWMPSSRSPANPRTRNRTTQSVALRPTLRPSRAARQLATSCRFDRARTIGVRRRAT